MLIPIYAGSSNLDSRTGVAIRSPYEANALGRHMYLDQTDEAPDFTFKVDKVWKTSLGRKIREAILIAQ